MKKLIKEYKVTAGGRWFNTFKTAEVAEDVVNTLIQLGYKNVEYNIVRHYATTEAELRKHNMELKREMERA